MSLRLDEQSGHHRPVSKSGRSGMDTEKFDAAKRLGLAECVMANSQDLLHVNSGLVQNPDVSTPSPSMDPQPA